MEQRVVVSNWSGTGCWGRAGGGCICFQGDIRSQDDRRGKGFNQRDSTKFKIILKQGCLRANLLLNFMIGIGFHNSPCGRGGMLFKNFNKIKLI